MLIVYELKKDKHTMSGIYIDGFTLLILCQLVEQEERPHQPKLCDLFPFLHLHTLLHYLLMGKSLMKFHGQKHTMNTLLLLQMQF